MIKLPKGGTSGQSRDSLTSKVCLWSANTQTKVLMSAACLTDIPTIRTRRREDYAGIWWDIGSKFNKVDSVMWQHLIIDVIWNTRSSWLFISDSSFPEDEYRNVDTRQTPPCPTVDMYVTKRVTKEGAQILSGVMQQSPKKLRYLNVVYFRAGNRAPEA